MQKEKAQDRKSNKEPNVLRKNIRTLILFVTIGVILFLFFSLIFILWKIGFFNFSGSEASSNIVAASLALVGTFLGAVASIIGVVFKYSIDQQTEIRLQIESDRNETLRWEAETRLKLDTAVHALSLFSSSSGQLTPIAQREGALFMLSDLKQHDLNLQLIGNLLPKGELSVSTAAKIISQVLERGDDNSRIDAIFLLYDNVSFFISPSGIELPTCILDWKINLPEYAREWTYYFLVKILLLRTAKEWLGKYLTSVNCLISIFCLAWSEEKSQRLKSIIGFFLNHIFRVFPPCLGSMYHPRMVINLESIKQEVENCQTWSLDGIDLGEQLSKWATLSDSN
ncbi:MAG: hypothetical protein JXD23_14355 [Spirochaetales bacterium]|nr:hypothetical protein [Spirochaetales bacterium]